MASKLRLEDATYGVELEIGDVDTKIKIPSSLGEWDYKDGSIMNSNGTANDPKKVLNRYGSEIHVSPSKSTRELTYRVMQIYELFPKKDFNFTTNLHPHIRVPGLKENLGFLKDVVRYLYMYGMELFELIDPIPIPTDDSYTSEESFRGAWKRYLRRKRSHHSLLSERAVEEALKAKSPEQFYEAHAPRSKTGRPQFHLVQRAGVNLNQLWSNTETIEFRCFTMSPDPEKLLSAFRFTRFFLQAVEKDFPPKKFLKQFEFVFQTFWPYDYKKDKIFQLTNVRHNKREVAEANYEKLIRKGILTKDELQ